MAIARMYEQVLAGNFLPPIDTAPPHAYNTGTNKGKEFWEKVKKMFYAPMIEQAVPFFIDDVALEYMDTSIDLSEAKVVIPYPYVWFEYQTPDKQFNFGMLFESRPWEEAIANPFFHIHKDTERQRKLAHMRPTVMIGIKFEQHLNAPIKGIRSFDAQKEVYVFSDGSLWNECILGDPTVKDIKHYDLISLFALALLNSNSRTIIEETPTSGFVANYAKKRNKRITYKTVIVKASGVRRVYNNSQTIGPQELPRHRVRGHFATYTEKAPLFGKWVGRYYVRSHWRGDPDVGEVVKDYKVSP